METLPPCIKCTVHTQYMEHESQPDKQRYVFAYLITIRNLSPHPVQLLSRRWLITDANGKQLVIEGDGVIGEQPTIDAQDAFTYTSSTVIETPVGVMQGAYNMLSHQGQPFTTDVEPFRLAIPNILN